MSNREQMLEKELAELMGNLSLAINQVTTVTAFDLLEAIEKGDKQKQLEVRKDLENELVRINDHIEQVSKKTGIQKKHDGINIL